MYNHELVLIGETTGFDEWENEVPIETRTLVLCKLMSVGRNEFYAAAQSGLRPELVFVIHAYEYSGERQVEFEGEKYKVVRTYQEAFEEVELVCERVIGDG